MDWHEGVPQVCSALRDMALYDGHARAYDALNGFDQICTWSDERQCFQHSGRRAGRPLLGVRQTKFANLVWSWGLQGKFLTNWSDAQGWDYRHRLPGLGGIPVIQYCRRAVQRGQVVLMPLPRYYMGPGGPNLPDQPDPMPFRAKRNRLAWRGSLTGTLSDWDREIWWVDAVFREKAHAQDFARARRVTRWRAADELRKSPLADVKLTLTDLQRLRMAASAPLQDLLRGLVGEWQSKEAARQSKFLLVVDGNDIGSNKYWSLLSNSVVLLVESEWETALDAGLVAGVHYVPVQANRQAIETTVEALLADEARCESIIAAAHELLAPQLRTDWRDAADWLTLQAYATRVRFVPPLPTTWSFSRG
ncbi:hypothetical protein GCM10009107_27170 [Ideonella azotifigens]|uniref:Glycosyl transferase CAP10 domain-containing protein n=1 Tax=Ideonella azotifigens TaxID=513160 RepID=A0ABN1K2A7_9BURK